MRKVGIIASGERDIGLVHTKEIAIWLKERDVLPLLPEDSAETTGLTECSADIGTIYAEAEFLIVLGGDGTILRVARNAAYTSVPLIGLNFGTLGYLTDVDKSQSFDALTMVLAGNYQTQKRMMLESQISSDGIIKEQSLALNDICVIHGAYSNMINIEVFINDEFIDYYRGDGFIAATPTGSTAYNLSAGGAILKPDSKMIALTPICPHMLYARPLVIPASDVVKIKLSKQKNTEGVVVVDGQSHTALLPENTVTIKCSNYYTSIIKTNSNSFFDILRHKMMRQ